jgi:hypothetical protein
MNTGGFNMRIPLSKWAKKHGLKRDSALNLARRGKLKTAKLVEVKVKRWTIEDSEQI